jgi:solute carrier family 30 (zinc transporter), member 5/7
MATIASGLFLGLFCAIYLGIFSSSLVFSNHSILFSALSIASATALVFFSLPATLRKRSKGGLVLGTLLTIGFDVWTHTDAMKEGILSVLVCVFISGAVFLDTHPSAAMRSTSHSHSHSGHHSHSHSHSQDHHSHHLHGNHSQLSAFLIERCTPGSILHSILIEKDSRRIAYFGV